MTKMWPGHHELQKLRLTNRFRETTKSSQTSEIFIHNYPYLQIVHKLPFMETLNVYKYETSERGLWKIYNYILKYKNKYIYIQDTSLSSLPQQYKIHC